MVPRQDSYVNSKRNWIGRTSPSNLSGQFFDRFPTKHSRQKIFGVLAPYNYRQETEPTGLLL